MMNPTNPLRLAAVFVLLIACLHTADALARDRLRIIAWEGYADKDIVSAFEQRYGVDVDVVVVNTDDEMWEKINRNNAEDYDVFAVNTAELQRYIDRKLSAPLDLAQIPNRSHQLLQFRELDRIPGLMRQGHTYGIPYAYSEMGLIYDVRKVKEPPRSMSAMWDSSYRGRVLAYNGSSHNFTVAAMLAGANDPFNLNAAEFERVTAKLVDLRRNVLTFYASPQEAVRLFIENDIVLVYGNYGSQQVKALRDAGADIGYVIPSEGALAWLDCWALTSTVRNRQLAERWINYTLEKSVSEQLSKKHGLANTVAPFHGAPDPQNLVWLRPVEDSAKRAQLWERILSGDSFGK